MSMSDYGVKIGIKADTGIMLLKPSTVSAVVNKGNNKITELRTILQRESKNS